MSWGFFEGAWVFFVLVISSLGLDCVSWAVMTDVESKGIYFSDLQDEK